MQPKSYAIVGRTAIGLVLLIGIVIVAVVLVTLIIKALRKYIKSESGRKEKAENAKSLGEAIKQHCMECKMTQGFVAETLGVT